MYLTCIFDTNMSDALLLLPIIDIVSGISLLVLVCESLCVGNSIIEFSFTTYSDH